jgi:hypothetical protein
MESHPTNFVLERAKKAFENGVSEGDFYATFSENVLADAPPSRRVIWESLQDAQDSGEWPYTVWSRFVFSASDDSWPLTGGWPVMTDDERLEAYVLQSGLCIDCHKPTLAPEPGDGNHAVAPESGGRALMCQDCADAYARAAR